MDTMLREPIAPRESEKLALNKLEGALKNEKCKPRLVGPDETYIELPNSIFQALRQIVYYMMRGKAIFIVPENKQCSPQEAADILGVSRPFVVKLIEQGKLSGHMVGSHHRIPFGELMRFKRERDEKRERSLDEIARLSQEYGNY